METVQQDTGLQCLALLLRFHQVSADPAQITHQIEDRMVNLSPGMAVTVEIKPARAG
jgi:subfamily B ATP-binding cassette protein HlyB/CyaB